VSSPIPRLWIPLTIDATNNKLRFRLDGGVTDYTATIASATYVDPESLLAALDTAMEAADGDARTYTITISATTGKVTILQSGTSIKVTSVANDCNELLGFVAAGASDFAVSNTSDYQAQNYWSPDIAPTFDSYDVTEITQGAQKSLDGHHLFVEHGTVTIRQVAFRFVDIWKVLQDEEGAYVYQSLERWWSAAKTKFRYWEDRETLGTYVDYFLEAPANRWRPVRMFPKPALYELDLTFGAYQS